ncbi:MAG: hypothetical protein H6819_08370 [Phycisphaerales bacterium]|nr:hypothetical protein [Phycisphaerales bacterium]MCB9854180.1 hypothetical protein [Phycisphaerales bacterium]
MERTLKTMPMRDAKTALFWGAYASTRSDTDRENETNLHGAAEWLWRSIDVTGVDGSSVCFSLYRGWMPAYPETTGYIIPTFYRYARQFDRPRFAERATAMARWITTLQTAEGALPGSHYNEGITRPPSVFNTAQMIIGLVSAYEETGDLMFLTSADRAATWLAKEQEESGAWSRFAYRRGFSPSYYTRVCWPMLMTTIHTSNSIVRERAIRGLRHIAARVRDNGTVAGWGFADDRPAFTHTIAYTIRGFLEAGMLGDDLSEFLAIAEVSAMKLFRIMELRKKLAGAYDDQWRGANWYVCLTGNCQVAICWMRLFDLIGDVRLCNAACKAIDVVTARQKLKPMLLRSIAGAIPGSAPLFGRYLTFRYPNWAAKFYLDAIMMRNDRLSKIRQHPPVAP